MEQIRSIRHARWLSSLDMAQLCHYAEQQGVFVSIGADREPLIERLAAMASFEQPVVQEVQSVPLSTTGDTLAVIEATPGQVTDEGFDGAQEEMEVQGSQLDRRGVENGPSAQALTEALELLAPLQNSRLIRGNSQMGDMLGSVLQQLQAGVFAPPPQSSAITSDHDEPIVWQGEHEQVVSANNGGELGLAQTAMAILAQSNNFHQGEHDLLGSASVGGSSASGLEADVAVSVLGPFQDQQPVIPAPTQADEPMLDAADASSIANETEQEHADVQTPSQVQHSLDGAGQHRNHNDRFAEYMARVEERRAQTRRRRTERLAQLNIALDQHFNAFAAGDFGAVDVPPAGDADFVERHTVTSVWAGADDTQCSICVEDIAQGDAVRTLSCGHVYHQECVDMWLQRSRHCCLCRRAIDAPRQSNL